MAELKQTPFSRKVFFALWAMATLVLLFTVVLLTNELIRLGRNPLTLPEVLPEPIDPIEAPASTGEPVDALLYFASADARQLVGDPRRLTYSERTIDNCRAALEAMIGGPVTPLHALIPETVGIRGMWVMENGELVVDFSDAIQTDARKGVSEEALLVYSVVNTLTQPALQGTDNVSVKSVRFLIGGLPPTVLYPAHLDLSGAITPDPQWIASQESGQPGNA